MKLAEFKKPAAPPVPEVSEPSEEPQGTSTVTPSGVTIDYEWAPRRLYRLNGVEVPSVTTVLGVLDKSGPLTWWGQKIGVEGMGWLQAAGKLSLNGDSFFNHDIGKYVDTDSIVAMLTEYKKSVNHIKDSAADRGVNVHGALEDWIGTRKVVPLDQWSEYERGYVQGVYAFLAAIEDSVVDTEAELMVGSLEHQYAGRFDLVLTLSRPVEVVTRHYPKKKDKVEEIPAGRYLMDLKTRKKAAVYNTNYLQLEAYEAAAVECGYAPTDYRAVIVVTEDGGYQVSINKDWCFEDFLAVRKCYQVLNEREVLRVLREELDAKEVALTPGQVKTLKGSA